MPPPPLATAYLFMAQNMNFLNKFPNPMTNGFLRGNEIYQKMFANLMQSPLIFNNNDELNRKEGGDSSIKNEENRNIKKEE